MQAERSVNIMANTNVVYARIDTTLKENAESILNQLGITPSSAIQMLYLKKDVTNPYILSKIILY